MASAIIVAAGLGSRMNPTGNSPRKQYLTLSGLPIISATLIPFDLCESIAEILLVVPENDFEFCRETVLSPVKLKKSVRLVAGGKRRQDSVRNGLLSADSKTDIVVIHDGVWPFVLPGLIRECIETARQHGACTTGVPVFDTVKKILPDGFIDKTVERDKLWTVQTPQAFQYDLIVKAHDMARKKGLDVTDDATLIEKIHKPVKLVAGKPYNIKITVADDLKTAKAYYPVFREDLNRETG